MGMRFTDQKTEFLHAGVEAIDDLGVMVLPIIKMSDIADSGGAAGMFDEFRFDGVSLFESIFNIHPCFRI